ncbi:hypothetical protein ACFX5K_06245, partial [Rickettsiales bacterium LUAb2]
MNQEQEYYIYLKQNNLIIEEHGGVDNVNYIDIIVKNDFDLLFNETVNTLYKLKETMSLLGFKYIEE